MAVTRTTPSMGRMLALMAGTAGLGFGSTALAQHKAHEPLERPARVRAVAEQTVLSGTARHLSKPNTKAKAHPSAVVARRPKLPRAASAPKRHDVRASAPVAQTPAAAPASAPMLQAPAQAPVATTPVAATPAPPPVPATPAPAAVVSGGS